MKKIVLIAISLIFVSCTKKSPSAVTQEALDNLKMFEFEAASKNFSPNFQSDEQIADYRGFMNTVKSYERNILKSPPEVLEALRSTLTFKVVSEEIKSRTAIVKVNATVPEFDKKFDMQIALLKLTRPPLVVNRDEAYKTIIENIKNENYELVTSELTFSLIKKEGWKIQQVTNTKELWRFNQEN